MKLLQTTIVIALVTGALIGGMRWSIAEVRENSRLEQQVNMLDDTANRLLWKLTAARVENDRLAKLTAEADRRPAVSKAERTELIDLRGEVEQNRATLDP